MKSIFSPEELEELRKFDSEIDAAEMTEEDYKISDFVDELLFPERAKKNARSRSAYAERKRAQIESGTYETVRQGYKKAYAAKDKDKERERKRRWYQENKGRVHAQQRAYRIKTGRQKDPEAKGTKTPKE